MDGDEDSVDRLKIIYLLYLGGLFGGVTAFAGLAMVYIFRWQAPGWQRSHYILLEHTFWKGLAMGVAGAILLPVFIGYLIWLYVLVWWVVRGLTGLRALAQRETILKPYTWGWRV